MRLDCAMIYVKDFPRMKEYYGRMLLVQPVHPEWADTLAIFDAGGTRLCIHAIPAEFAQQIAISSPPEARENSPVKLVFTVDDVPAERARLEALGITLLQRSWQNPTEACDGIDPEGNVFQISAAAR